MIFNGMERKGDSSTLLSDVTPTLISHFFALRRLDERERRRNFITQRNLVRVKHFQSQERRRTPPEREILSRLRVFARFESVPGEHDELVEGILLEHRLRARIQVR